jgi:hypothetical protein
MRRIWVGILTVLAIGAAFAPAAVAATLYGVTGDGGSAPETLYTLSQTDASRTFVRAFGNGDDGEAIAFNPDDGLLYHASGSGAATPSTTPDTGRSSGWRCPVRRCSTGTPRAPTRCATRTRTIGAASITSSR